MSNIRVLLALTTLLAASASVASAGVPFTFPTQGRALDAAGNAHQGATSVTFSIYDGDPSGNQLWSETHPNLVFSDGYYAADLGTQTPLPDGVFASGPRYLGVVVGGTELLPRSQVLMVPMSRMSQSVEVSAGPPVPCNAASQAGRTYFDATSQTFRGCDGTRWGALGGVDSGTVPSGGAGTPSDPGRSCLDIHQTYPNLGDGLYWIDPDGDGTQTQVQCDMTRAGGGWTFGVKNWHASGTSGQQGAIGSVANALTRKGATYKLSDTEIRNVIGSSNNFDVLMDQSGYNTAYSGGNYEYVTLENYTGFWTFGSLVDDSATPTTMKSYRASDGALAWTGYLRCGPGGASASGYGVNCYDLDVGTNPAGGSGCSPNMGNGGNSGWHDFTMGRSNTDTYLYICNGAQHNSGHDMNHRVWFRERQPPRTSTIGLQSNPGRTCKTIHAQDPVLGDGIYWIDPESDGSPIQVQCDMTRLGGGWTFGIKNWQGAAVAGNAGALGSVADALTLEGSGYKLSDNDINDLIGPSRNFDLLADQAGYNTAYSAGNYEMVVIENYTGTFTFAAPTAASTTTTTMRSYRRRDGALAWTGNLACGNVASAGHGINCYDVLTNNPAGGSGCSINMGSQGNAGWHDFTMARSNGDTYLYICNGAQHSSGYNMNHRFWFRERN